MFRQRKRNMPRGINSMPGDNLWYYTWPNNFFPLYFWQHICVLVWIFCKNVVVYVWFGLECLTSQLKWEMQMENQESLTKTFILIISKNVHMWTRHMAATSITSMQLIIVMETYWFYANEIWECICEKYLFICHMVSPAAFLCSWICVHVYYEI